MDVRPARASDAAAVVAIWNDIIDTTAITFATQHKTAAGITADIG